MPFPLPPPAAHLSIARAAIPDYVAMYVEGPSDFEMWRSWTKWPPQVAGGKQSVLAAIAEMERHSLAGFLGVVDADFDHAAAVTHSPNVVTTECHDLECDLLRCPSLARVVVGLDDATLVSLQSPHSSLSDALVARGEIFGYARWVFLARQAPYPHGRLSPFRFTDPATWIVREDELYAEAAAVLNLGKSQFTAEVQGLRLRGVDPWQISNGHDLVSLLTILLQGALGQKRKFPSDDVVAMMLRLGAGADIHGLFVTRGIQDWERRNSGFAVLVKL
jgi:hypothetical protein